MECNEITKEDLEETIRIILYEDVSEINPKSEVPFEIYGHILNCNQCYKKFHDSLDMRFSDENLHAYFKRAENLRKLNKI